MGVELEPGTVTICDKCEHVYETRMVECPQCRARAREEEWKARRRKFRFLCWFGIHKMEITGGRFGLVRTECTRCGKEEISNDE